MTTDNPPAKFSPPLPLLKSVPQEPCAAAPKFPQTRSPKAHLSLSQTTTGFARGFFFHPNLP